MNRKVAALTAAGVFLLALSSVPAHGAQRSLVPVTGAAAGASQVIGADTAPVDERVLDFLLEEDLPGATVAVTKNSRLVWSKGYGYADAAAQRPMLPETRSKIGSGSKFLTAVGALRLVEEGTLDLGQYVYSSGAAPLWGSDRGSTPGVLFLPDGILENPGAYFEAIVTGVNDSSESFPPSEHLDEWPSAAWAQLNQAAYEQAMTTALDRASGIRVEHLLSHTAGLVNSTGGAKEAAAAHFGTTETELTYEQLHQGILMGLADVGSPFMLDPGTDEDYSNMGFFFAGHIIGALSSEGDYGQYTENRLLGPLGLFDVVPNNASISDLDALPHDSNNVPLPLDPDSVSRLLLATGGWSASARDLARAMCSIDGNSNNLRSLDPAAVEVMAADAAPGAPGVNPLGWDSSSGGELTKNGSLPNGGSSRITKFLPGALENGPEDEINVAVNVNKGSSVPSSQLLSDIAELVAQADFPADYDLFDPAFACYVEPSLSVAAETPAPRPAGDPTTDDRNRTTARIR